MTRKYNITTFAIIDTSPHALELLAFQFSIPQLPNTSCATSRKQPLLTIGRLNMLVKIFKNTDLYTYIVRKTCIIDLTLH